MSQKRRRATRSTASPAVRTPAGTPIGTPVARPGQVVPVAQLAASPTVRGLQASSPFPRRSSSLLVAPTPAKRRTRNEELSRLERQMAALDDQDGSYTYASDQSDDSDEQSEKSARLPAPLQSDTSKRDLNTSENGVKIEKIAGGTQESQPAVVQPDKGQASEPATVSRNENILDTESEYTGSEESDCGGDSRGVKSRHSLAVTSRSAGRRKKQRTLPATSRWPKPEMARESIWASPQSANANAQERWRLAKKNDSVKGRHEEHRSCQVAQDVHNTGRLATSERQKQAIHELDELTGTNASGTAHMPAQAVLDVNAEAERHQALVWQLQQMVQHTWQNLAQARLEKQMAEAMQSNAMNDKDTGASNVATELPSIPAIPPPYVSALADDLLDRLRDLLLTLVKLRRQGPSDRGRSMASTWRTVCAAARLSDWPGEVVDRVEARMLENFGEVYATEFLETRKRGKARQSRLRCNERTDESNSESDSDIVNESDTEVEL
ncbi:hypothetical protein THASP1DRAFT_28854 [Thamnocephalis sphaerospora]|uniref:Uncharacterized protein n=1 Tax=Thamnocephalis sphaerospora TaxID=78915 RepID=A0A4P9XT63_9FUNG|nr:hypothetical protein THASP1DRAFT_28854 [Thamnocephalis sphaerospora]|eukprot:RKP09354.1 hypothetical protein THASP1DRAFT_28854 [Thamnocephalis sphaerospora]